MALKTFASGESVTLAACNEMVNNIPKTFPYALESPNREFVQAVSAGVRVEIIRVDVNPIVGDYLYSHVDFKGSSGLVEAEWRISLTNGISTDIIFSTSTSSTSFVPLTAVKLLTSLPNIGDATGSRIDIVIELYSAASQTITWRNLRLFSGMKSTASSYLS